MVDRAEPSSAATALHLAVGSLESVQALLEAGAQANSADAGGSTPAHLAAAHGSGEVIAALVAAGGDVGRENARGDSPLCVAAAAGNVPAVRALLAAGASPANITPSGLTAL